MDNMIVLNDENGNDVNFEFLDLVELDDEQYVILLEEGDDMVTILKEDHTQDEDVSSYISVEDEALLMEIFEIFKEKFKDEFNFE